MIVVKMVVAKKKILPFFHFRFCNLHVHNIIHIFIILQIIDFVAFVM